MNNTENDLYEEQQAPLADADIADDAELTLEDIEDMHDATPNTRSTGSANPYLDDHLEDDLDLDEDLDDLDLEDLDLDDESLDLEDDLELEDLDSDLLNLDDHAEDLELEEDFELEEESAELVEEQAPAEVDEEPEADDLENEWTEDPLEESEVASEVPLEDIEDALETSSSELPEDGDLLDMEPGSPLEKGYDESRTDLNRALRDNLVVYLGNQELNVSSKDDITTLTEQFHTLFAQDIDRAMKRLIKVWQSEDQTLELYNRLESFSHHHATVNHIISTAQQIAVAQEVAESEMVKPHEASDLLGKIRNLQTILEHYENMFEKLSH